MIHVQIKWKQIIERHMIIVNYRIIHSGTCVKKQTYITNRLHENEMQILYYEWSYAPDTKSFEE